MSSAPVASLVVVLTLVAVLCTSGIAKIVDRRSTIDAFHALRIPGVVPVDAAAVALPWTELALAALLLVAPAGWLVAVALAVVMLMLAYTVVIARALGFDEPVSCSCFGRIGRHDVDRATLWRNVLLTGLSASALWFALDGGSAPAAIADLRAADWWTLLAAAAAAVVAVLVVGRGGDRYGPPSDEPLDYERQAIPFGALTLPDGSTSTLSELARTQARLLVVLSPGCRPCVRTAEKLDELAVRLAPAVGVVAVHPNESAMAATLEHSPALGAWEPDLNIRRVFSVATPAAVLLGADGLLAGGPVTGENDVAQFFDDVVEALAEQPRAHG